MSSEDIIRSWKDPDGRGESPGADHPSGGIVLSGDDSFGGSGWTSIIIETTIIATHGLSCLPECQHTVAQGSCPWLTYACC